MTLNPLGATAALPLALAIATSASATNVVEPATSEVQVRLISTDLDGAPLDFQSHASSVVNRGRLVAWTTRAPHVVEGDDLVEFHDVFVTDLTTGDTSLVSAAEDGSPANGDSYGAELSRNGRYVAFESFARDIVPYEGPTHRQIFMRDLRTGTTILVSKRPDGRAANDDSYGTSMSRTGRRIAYTTAATNLVRDIDASANVVVFDRSTKSTTLVGRTPSGAAPNGSSIIGALSSDGNVATFYSYANNIVSDDRETGRDVFRTDLSTGHTTLISRRPDGQPANGSSETSDVSADGRFVAYKSFASDLVPGDVNNDPDVFIYDHQTGGTKLVSATTAGVPPDSEWGSVDPTISTTGRFVAYQTDASELVPGEDNGQNHIVRFDRRGGRTALVDQNLQGSPIEQASYRPEINSNGRWISFLSSGDDLVAGVDVPELSVFLRQM